MSKTIRLTRGHVAIVNDADHQWLSRWNWCAKVDGAHVYAVRRDYTSDPPRMVRMHRQILQPGSELDTDHRNGDGLDNRRGNLRPCTRSQNLMNATKRSGCTSIYKGVSWFKPIGKWRAYIVRDQRQQSLGYFDDEQEAARAYNEAAAQLFGQFARLNQIPSITAQEEE